MTETEKDENLRELSKPNKQTKKQAKMEENRRESWSAQNKQMVK